MPLTNSHINIHVDKKENYVSVAFVQQRLDTLSFVELKKIFAELVNEGNKSLLLDLSSCEYCDSSGLSAILNGNRLCKNSGGKFALIIKPESNVMKVIKISQLDSILKIYSSVEESLEFLK